jgi:hypothetical protein
MHLSDPFHADFPARVVLDEVGVCIAGMRSLYGRAGGQCPWSASRTPLTTGSAPCSRYWVLHCSGVLLLHHVADVCLTSKLLDAIDLCMNRPCCTYTGAIMGQPAAAARQWNVRSCALCFSAALLLSELVVAEITERQTTAAMHSRTWFCCTSASTADSLVECEYISGRVGAVGIVSDCGVLFYYVWQGSARDQAMTYNLISASAHDAELHQCISAFNCCRNS